MITQLYTNGCSWTWGGALKDKNNKVFGVMKDSVAETDEESLERRLLLWPHHLGLRMGIQNTYNYSLGCGSNQRIFRTTLEWLLTQTLEDLHNTLAVIQFTEPSRFEFYYGNDRNYERERWAACNVLNIVNYNGKLNKNNYIDLRLQTYSPIEGIYSVISYMLALSKLFETFGLNSYYFWFMRNGDQTAIENIIPSSFLSNVIHIPDDGYNRVGNIVDNVGNVMYDYHPSEKGHMQIAEIIHSEINKRNIINNNL